MALTPEQHELWNQLKLAMNGDGAALESVFATGGGGGDVNAGANVGTGTGEVYKETTGGVDQFRRIKNGEGISVGNDGDDVLISVNTAGIDLNPPEEFYKQTTQQTTTSGSWTTMDSHTFNLTNGGDYWIFISSVIGAEKKDKEHQLRVRVNGNILVAMIWDVTKDDGQQGFSWQDELLSLPAGNNTVEFQMRSGDDEVRLARWNALVTEKA